MIVHVPLGLLVLTALLCVALGVFLEHRHTARQLRVAQHLAHEYQCRLAAEAARIKGAEAWRFFTDKVEPPC